MHFMKQQIYWKIENMSRPLKEHNRVDTGRKLNVHKTFTLRPVSTRKAPMKM